MIQHPAVDSARWPVGCFPDSSQDEGLLPRGDHEEHCILSDWQEHFQLVAGEKRGPHLYPRAGERARPRRPGPGQADRAASRSRPSHSGCRSDAREIVRVQVLVERSAQDTVMMTPWCA